MPHSADKMRPDTIAVLFCLLLVTVGIGHTIISSGVILKVIDCLCDIYDEIYAQVDYFYWDLCYEYTNNGIPTYIRVFAIFTVYACTPRALGKFLLWPDIFLIAEACQNSAQELAEKRESQNMEKPTTPIISPVTPIPPKTAPSTLVLPADPPPFQFPFKNFRGTGESFTHPDRNNPMQYPIYRLPRTWGRSRPTDRGWMATSMQMSASYRSPEGENLITEATTSSPEEIQHVAKSAMNDTVKDVVIMPAHNAIELPVQSAPAPTLTPSAYTPAPSHGSQTTPKSAPLPSPSSSQATDHVQATLPIYHSPHNQDHENSEVMLPLNLPSPEVLRNAAIQLQLNALESAQGQEHEVVTAMWSFVVAMRNGTGCEEPAVVILNLMEGAKSRLQEFFPNGLVGLNEENLIWKVSVVQFWDEFRPHGWTIKQDTDDTLRIFLEHYWSLAIWLGLQHHLGDLDFTEPIVSPVQVPVQIQQSLPTTQMPSRATVQQNAAPTISEPPLSNQPTFQEYGTQPPPLSTQVPSAPKTQTQSVLFTFTATIPAPSKPVAQTPQTPSTTFAPIQQQSVQQPQVAQGAPDLLDFDSYKWCQKSDEALLELTWESFLWPNGVDGRSKIWSYSSMGGLKLPAKLPKFFTELYVKTELDKVALEFRRAAVILRLQVTDCERPDGDDLPMMPILGELEEMVRRAGIMMVECKEKIEWYGDDEFYSSAYFFHEHVRRNKDIRNKLYAGYGGSNNDPNVGRDEWDALIRGWRTIKEKCLEE